MGRVIVQNNAFCFIEENGEYVLLDCNNFLANKSRMPMHSLEGGETIPGILLGLLKQQEEKPMEYLLADILLTANFIQSPLPVSVLEMGCKDGILSYHIATLLGKFNRESSLCCICNTIGNESGNCWLDRIVMVEEPPRLSFMATDYDNIRLENKCFDIVILNGFGEDFEEPYIMIKEAKKIVKNGGMVIGCLKEQTLMLDCLRLEFEEREEYILDSQSCIICVKNIDDMCEEGQEKKRWMETVGKCLDEVKYIIENGAASEAIRKLVRELDKYIEFAIEDKELDMKIGLIRKKEQLLDKMYDMENG